MPTKTENEKGDSERKTNVYAALGVGFVCVVIGLPLWWKTTQVYRVALPYSDIETLVDTKIEYSVDVKVISYVEQFKSEELVALSKNLMKTFDSSTSTSSDANIKATYSTYVWEATIDEAPLLESSQSLADLDQKLAASLTNAANTYYVVVLPKDNRLVSKPTLGLHRSVYIPYTGQKISSLADDIVKVVRTTIVREDSIIKGLKALKAEKSKKSDKELLRSVRYHPGYDIILTLVSPQPHIIDVDWDMEQAVNDYLDPFVSKISKYTDLSIKSQVLFYARVAVKPHASSDGFYYKPHDLPHMINPLESKLGSPASTNPELNFLVYVPPKEQYPLYIKDDKGERLENNAFLSPQWGGICIYNVAPPSANSSLPLQASVDMRPVMGVILSQLRLLLNLQAEASDGLQMMPLGNSALTEWELDAWMRSRTVENLATSSATLHSLSSLLGKISNIVIVDDIGKTVEIAVTSIQQSHQLLSEGKLVEAFLQSRTASIASEKAFFDPSLLELLYFPEDQKFAIYIPLFLPISFPVLSSLWQAYKWYRGEPKPKQD